MGFQIMVNEKEVMKIEILQKMSCVKKGSWEIRYLKLQTIKLETLVGKYGNP